MTEKPFLYYTVFGKSKTLGPHTGSRETSTAKTITDRTFPRVKCIKALRMGGRGYVNLPADPRIVLVRDNSPSSQNIILSYLFYMINVYTLVSSAQKKMKILEYDCMKKKSK